MVNKVAVLAGDGIGPEVMQQALRVLEVITRKYQHEFEFISAAIGGAAYDQYQQHCPDQTLEICQQADAVLFGSVGGPPDQQHLPKWQACETNSILKLRQHFNFSCNLRPIRIYPELVAQSPLKSERIAQGVDLLIVRELSGGIYFGAHHRQQDSARDVCDYKRDQIVQIANHAFRLAQQREGKLCSVDKANVLATSQLWRQVVSEVAQSYPDVELTHLLVDNCAMQLVLNPQQFDVIVTENLFGDILSDLAAALPGSLGLIPSASINSKQQGLYEPSGGSAPDIAGQGVANPSAQILSAAMMLRHSFDMQRESAAIEQALYDTIVGGGLTADFSAADTALSTEQFTHKIIENLS